MEHDVTILMKDESFVKLKGDRQVLQEIQDHFTFFVPGYKFMPAFKSRLWDGKMRLLNLNNNEIYRGLIPYIEAFCEQQDYSFTFQDPSLTATDQISEFQLKKFVEELNIHSGKRKIDVRDYQLDAVLHALRFKRTTLLSPTSCLDPETEIEVDIYDSITNINLIKLEKLIKSGIRPKISTPSGFEYITDTYRKNGPGVEIEFENTPNTIKAANNHLMFIDGDWKESYKLKVGDSINDKVISKITNTEIQDWIDFSIDADHESYYHEGILHHNSGKSLIIYLIIQYLTTYKFPEGKGLLIVPTTQLVEQMYSDFADYSSEISWNVEDYAHRIYSGKEKIAECGLYISTWQSLHNLDASYFKQFDYVINDEVHLAKGNSITKVVSNCINAQYRVGLTGTLDGSKCNSKIIEGLFGAVKKVITTKELMDRKQVSDFKIKCMILKYSEDICKINKKLKYQDEIKFLISNKERNKFIKNLALSMQNNTLVLYNYVDTHGKILFEMIKNSKHIGDRKVFFIHGGVDAHEREEIRKIVEKESNAVIVASSGTFSTGTNLKNLHNIIFASPSKSRVRNLQSIGRGLRLSDNKSQAVLYDIADDLRYKTHKNFTLEHFAERIKIYNDEKFEYKLYNIKLQDIP